MDIELTADEKLKITAQRELDGRMKDCTEEIKAVLEKYGMTLQIYGGNPQIKLMPKNTQ